MEEIKKPVFFILERVHSAWIQLREVFWKRVEARVKNVVH